MSDLLVSKAITAQTGRALSPGYHVRRATVTATTPLTIQFADGTTLASVPSVPTYGKGFVGDVVRVEFDGAAPLVLASLVTKPWAEPWGLVAQNHGTPGITGITTGTDVLAVSFTATAGRLLAWYVHINLKQNTGAGHQAVGIHDGAGFINERTHIIAPAAGNFVTHAFSPYPRAWSGSKTWNIRCSTSANTCDTDGEASIYVVDVGPS